MKKMKTLILTLILMITSITINAQEITACRGTNDSIEIHGGVGPYTWVMDSLHFSMHSPTQSLSDCSNAIYNINNDAIIIGIKDTTPIIFYFGYNTTIKPYKTASITIRYSFPPDTIICSTSGLQITNVYPIRIYDINGDSLIINSASELQYPTATITSIDESSSLFCDGLSIAQLSIGVTQINWLNANSTLLSTIDSVSNLCAGTYTLNLTDSIGCKNTYTTVINTGPIPTTQPICLITVDPTNTHNLLVWDKTNLEPAVDSVIIYREITTNNYQRVGAQHKDSLSAFDDYLANPNVTGYRYKLTTKSATNVESVLSTYHNTIYLTNNGANFQWTQYQIEGISQPVAQYKLWRDDESTGSFQTIATTTGIQNGVTDINFSSFPNASYYVEAVMITGDCNPTRTITGARSNTKHIGAVTIENLNKLNITIYPNPTTTDLHFNGIYSQTKICIYDVVGKLVIDEETDKDIRIDVSALEEGVYTIITESIAGTTYNKIVVAF